MSGIRLRILSTPELVVGFPLARERGHLTPRAHGYVVVGSRLHPVCNSMENIT